MTRFQALGYAVTLHEDPDCPPELAQGIDGTPWCYDIATAEDAAEDPDLAVSSCTGFANEDDAREAAFADVTGMLAKEHHNGILIPDAIPVRSEEGHLYEPWTDGWAVGFKVTHGTTGEVRYVYLNPSSSDEPTGNAIAFVYQGIGDACQDEPIIYVDAFDDGGESNDVAPVILAKGSLNMVRTDEAV